MAEGYNGSSDLPGRSYKKNRKGRQGIAEQNGSIPMNNELKPVKVGLHFQQSEPVGQTANKRGQALTAVNRTVNPHVVFPHTVGKGPTFKKYRMSLYAELMDPSEQVVISWDKQQSIPIKSCLNFSCFIDQSYEIYVKVEGVDNDLVLQTTTIRKVFKSLPENNRQLQ